MSYEPGLDLEAAKRLFGQEGFGADDRIVTVAYRLARRWSLERPAS